MKTQHRGIVSGAEAADMFQTHGFPPELFETLAAERNLAFDWNGFRARDGAARDRVGRRAEGRTLPPPARWKP